MGRLFALLDNCANLHRASQMIICDSVHCIATFSERGFTMRLAWLNNGFISKDLYTPFTVDKDIDYFAPWDK